MTDQNESNGSKAIKEIFSKTTENQIMSSYGFFMCTISWWTLEKDHAGGAEEDRTFLFWKSRAELPWDNLKEMLIKKISISSHSRLSYLYLLAEIT